MQAVGPVHDLQFNEQIVLHALLTRAYPELHVEHTVEDEHTAQFDEQAKQAPLER